MKKIIYQPALTQTLGPWFKNEELKYSKKLAKEKDYMEELIRQLPRFSSFKQNWNYNISNWLPFYWKGFKQTTRYTYVIENINDISLVVSNFESSKRKNIKKSEPIIDVKFDIPIDEFYKNHTLTLKKQGAKIQYSRDLFHRIYTAAYKNKSGKTIGAYDKNGNLHAALFVIWDDESAYNLISTIDPDFRTFGAASLLVKEIINFVSDKTQKFDFEGSMIEPVERSFRQFGAIQKPYHSIYKSKSKILDILSLAKSWIHK